MSDESEQGGRPQVSSLLWCGGYLAVMYGGLVVSVLAGGLGHGLIWPLAIWFFLALPGSLLIVVTAFRRGANELVDIAILLAAPIINVAIWSAWSSRKQRSDVES